MTDDHMNQGNQQNSTVSPMNNGGNNAGSFQTQQKPQPVTDPSAYSVDTYQPPLNAQPSDILNAWSKLNSTTNLSDLSKLDDSPAMPNISEESSIPQPPVQTQADESNTTGGDAEDTTSNPFDFMPLSPEDYVFDTDTTQPTTFGNATSGGSLSKDSSQNSTTVVTSEPSSMPQIESTESTPKVVEQTELSQSLETQNIFTLLGVTDATQEEKDAFLDELQDVIWEDFLANDVSLLLTQTEQAELAKMQQDTSLEKSALQEKIVVYLEGLIPDLEQIMLEKAMELKEDMVRERVAGLREYFAGNESALARIDTAASLIAEEKWRDATAIMNTLVNEEVASTKVVN